MAVSYDLAQVLTEASLRLADGNPDFGPACAFLRVSSRTFHSAEMWCVEGMPLVFHRRKDARTPQCLLVPSARVESLASLDVY